jgi:hypothetical protein
VGTDDAAITGDTFPAQLTAGASQAVTISVTNTGTTTWTRLDGYRLGAVGDSDPLASTTRVGLDDGEQVPPGASRAFVVPIAAPAQPGTYTSDWQMVHEGLQWFGASVSHPQLSYSC